MPTYDGVGFDPPAPVAEALVAGPGGQVAVTMLLDSGADVTLVPRYVAQAVGASLESLGVVLASYDGNQTSWDVAEVRLDFSGYRFRGAYVVADTDRGVIGRDILNRLVLVLDGPREEWFVDRRAFPSIG